ncbi:serine/threonine protein kinase [Paenibacillus sp. GCM10012303]|uniref:serine/threonine protein kinase n=1 Tax=Paenibacillus sp. GCM10012303 TaxID=3317340 RepID=UPI003623D810
MHSEHGSRRYGRWKALAEEMWRRVREAVLDRPLRAGTVLDGRYAIERVLGIGSYGISYLCKDRRIGQKCVVKQVRPSRRKGRKGLPVFEREAAVLASLDHPGVPKLLNRFSERRNLFLCMEYMRGRNLEDALFADGRTFTLLDALRVVRGITDILRYVHSKGFVHRDVRIPNIMIRLDGQLALIDFGLACPVATGASVPTAASDMEEGDDYPEEKRIRREPVFASDFYALGHCLLFMLYADFEEQPGQPERGWEEELTLPDGVRLFIRRLLQIERPFPDLEPLRRELDELIRSEELKPERE